MSHVLLIGFMGSGKSTVGRHLARNLGLPFVDLDRRIESVAGRSISDIFTEDGEDAFRRLESEALARLADAPDSVVACGGGVVVVDSNRALLKSLGTVIFLRVSAGEAIARIGDAKSRPLLAGPGAGIAATSLLQARESLYALAADAVVDTEGVAPPVVASRVMEALNGVQS